MFFGKVTHVVLERVRDPSLCDAHPTLAIDQAELVFHQGFEALVVVAVVGEHDVPADVPGETVGISEGVRKAPHERTGFEEFEVGAPKLLEAIGGTETGRTAAQDDDAARSAG